MCGRYVLSRPGDVIAETLETLEGYELASPVPDDLQPRYNVAPTQVMPILSGITPSRDSADDPARVRIELGRWAFGAAGSGRPLINARCETLLEKRSFSRAFREQRCLVPADGFFEWRPDGNRQPFLFTLPRRKGFCFAGLRRAVDGDGTAPSAEYCIVTGPAGREMARIHHRRPVILERRHHRTWLDPASDPEHLLGVLGSDDPALDHHPVDFAVNAVRRDDPDLLQEVVEAPTNLRLF